MFIDESYSSILFVLSMNFICVSIDILSMPFSVLATRPVQALQRPDLLAAASAVAAAREARVGISHSICH